VRVQVSPRAPIYKGKKMAKTNSGFNLSKTTKYRMSAIIDPVKRNLFKKIMIDAEASYQVGKNRKFSDPAVAQKGPNKNTQES
jgi:hypothetical protein